MDEIRTYLLLPLFYLTMTSGLPPGSFLSNVPSETNVSTNFINVMNTARPEHSSTWKLPMTSDVATSWNNDVSKSESSEKHLTLTNNGDSVTTTTQSTYHVNPGPVANAQDKSESANDKTGEANKASLIEPSTTADTPQTAMLRNITKVPLRSKCNITDQCDGDFVDCRVGICKCVLGYLPRSDNPNLCEEASQQRVEVPQTDPTMIGVVVGLALMSVTLCVVLRLFAKARFRENRTIFNTPNPRLMNVSLLKGSKTLLRGNSAGGQRSRRGSQASVASGQEGMTPTSPTIVDNGAATTSNARPKPSRQLSTDTSSDSRPAGKKGLRGQDSVASNV